MTLTLEIPEEHIQGVMDLARRKMGVILTRAQMEGILRANPDYVTHEVMEGSYGDTFAREWLNGILTETITGDKDLQWPTLSDSWETHEAFVKQFKEGAAKRGYELVPEIWDNPMSWMVSVPR